MPEAIIFVGVLLKPSSGRQARMRAYGSSRAEPVPPSGPSNADLPLWPVTTASLMYSAALTEHLLFARPYVKCKRPRGPKSSWHQQSGTGEIIKQVIRGKISATGAKSSEIGIWGKGPMWCSAETCPRRSRSRGQAWGRYAGRRNSPQGRRRAGEATAMSY